MQAKDLETLLKSEIPISQQLGVHDFRLGNDELRLRLDLKPNVNHKGTLFGGSLYSAGALSCYALFLSGLREGAVTTNNIVIAEGNMKYIAPVAEDAVVRAFWNSPEEKEQFFKTLASKNKARVLMRAQVLNQNKVCAEFSGYFVAHQ
jgi:thioesterase domain-containing protein